MAEYIRFVDAIDGEPNYDSEAYAQAEEVKAEGVAYGYLNQLEVIEDTALQVIVKDGGMVSRGRIYIQDEPYDGAEPKTIAVEAAASGYLRKDRIVIEFDIDNKAAAAKLVKGTEVTADPAAPELTDDSDNWQVSLATINVSGSEITSIEDERIIGNGRTNPVFSEDVSAPNIKINDGGKIYLNDAETAYLQYSSDELNLKLSDSSETEGLRGNPAEICAFSAYLGVNTVHTGYSIIQYDTKIYDVGNNYDESNYIFTAPVNGLYAVLVGIAFGVPTGGGDGGVKVTKNGTSESVLSALDWSSETAQKIKPNASKDILLEAGDTLTCIFDYGGSKTIYGGEDISYFTVRLVRNDS